MLAKKGKKYLKCRFCPRKRDVFSRGGQKSIKVFSYFCGTAGPKIKKSMTRLVPSLVPVACGRVLKKMFFRKSNNFFTDKVTD